MVTNGIAYRCDLLSFLVSLCCKEQLGVGVLANNYML